jgi:hypothetical protein
VSSHFDASNRTEFAERQELPGRWVVITGLETDICFTIV